MRIIKVGVQHQACPIEIREKIAFSQDDIEPAMLELNRMTYIKENIIVSTCNRTEIYAVTEDVNEGMKVIDQFIASWFQLEQDEFTPFLKRLSDEEAILHLFRLTAGLDSMVLGETQILGQVKQAFLTAQEIKTSDKLFNELFKRVVTFAKRAHKDTAIGEQAVSISYVAVELAKKLFGKIEQQHVLILGAGETSELTLKNLQGAGVSNITVANRTLENAQTLAEKFQAEAVPIDALEQALSKSDIIISSTAATKAVLTKEMLMPIQKKRKGNPLFIIDIAVPRDIDPSIAELDSVFLYDIDDLEEVVNENIAARRKTAALIEKQLIPELASYNNWVAMLDAVPLIRALQEKSLHIQAQTLESIQRKMPDLTEREIKVLQKHTKSIIHQILEEPIKQVKSMGKSEKDLKMFQTIFGLDHKRS